MSGKADLKKMFGGLQKQMTAQLNANRDIIKHPGSKGDSLENAWIDWLKVYLPNRYCVDKAIIIDSKGNLSDQIDLVIYDQHFTPFVFQQNGVSYIPAEGVYAVFEVKPNIKKGYIKYAGDKIASVRKLHRTSTNIIDRGVRRDPSTLTKIVGGILAIDSDVTDKTIAKHLRDKTNSGLNSIDMGCAISFGSFYVDYNGSEDNSILDHNKRINEYYNLRTVNDVEFSKKSNSLVTFFLQLTRYLQQSIGTVAAIDLGAYADAINFDLDEEL